MLDPHSCGRLKQSSEQIPMLLHVCLMCKRPIICQHICNYCRFKSCWHGDGKTVSTLLNVSISFLDYGAFSLPHRGKNQISQCIIRDIHDINKPNVSQDSIEQHGPSYKISTCTL